MNANVGKRMKGLRVKHRNTQGVKTATAERRIHLRYVLCKKRQNLPLRLSRIRRFSIPRSKGHSRFSKAGTVSGCKSSTASSQMQTGVKLRENWVWLKSAVLQRRIPTGLPRSLRAGSSPMRILPWVLVRGRVFAPPTTVHPTLKMALGSCW